MKGPCLNSKMVYVSEMNVFIFPIIFYPLNEELDYVDI